MGDVMDLNNIISSIPSLLGGLCESIYLINKDKEVCYWVQYTGEQLKISAPKSYDEFKTYCEGFKDNLLERVESNNNFKGLVRKLDGKEKLINVINYENHILLLVIDVTNNSEVNSDKKVLLIADDSPVITKFFKKLFQDEYEVLVASNGIEAIDIVEQYKDKNLIGFFCDLMMPEMDGYEVLEYFKNNNLFEKVPVSVISGEDSQDGVMRATSYGIVDMLQKPFNETSARSIVDKTISFSPNNK